jgi:hypothetical protein
VQVKKVEAPVCRRLFGAKPGATGRSDPSALLSNFFVLHSHQKERLRFHWPSPAGAVRVRSFMALPIKLISTDFDGTFFAEFENPPVPPVLQTLIGTMQERGARWVINTGRDLSGLLESLGRSHLSIHPDFLVVVEREIYVRHDSQYLECEAWNRACTAAHRQLFERVRPDLPRLTAWVRQRFSATLYEDIYSPLCFIAEKNEDAEAIHKYLDDYCREVPGLMVVRNDVYARFSHRDYNKGSALAEIARLLKVSPDETFAAGDHFNDLPMLALRHARWLAAPGNAIDVVKDSVRRQNGYVSRFQNGLGVADGLEFCLKRATVLGFVDLVDSRDRRNWDKI